MQYSVYIADGHGTVSTSVKPGVKHPFHIRLITTSPGRPLLFFHSLYLKIFFMMLQNLETALAGGLGQMSLVKDYQTFRPKLRSSSVIVRYRAW